MKRSSHLGVGVGVRLLSNQWAGQGVYEIIVHDLGMTLICTITAEMGKILYRRHVFILILFTDYLLWL